MLNNESEGDDICEVCHLNGYLAKAEMENESTYM